MNQPVNWQKIDVPRGAYIGWGLRAGQVVCGKVVEYAPTGGRDFNQEVCPALAIELIEEAWSADKAQNWTKHSAGDLVQLNAGQVSLKRAIYAADPHPGDLVRIELENILFGAGKQGGDVKEFGIQIARGAGGPPRQAPSASPQQQQAPQPNFGAPQQQPQQGPQFNGGQQAPTNYPPQQPPQQPAFAGQQQPPGPSYPAPDQPGPWGSPAPTAPVPGPSGMASDPPPF